MDRAITVLATIARLNIDERLAKISAERARLLAEMLRGVLGDSDLGLSAEQRAAVPAVMRRHLAVV